MAAYTTVTATAGTSKTIYGSGRNGFVLTADGTYWTVDVDNAASEVIRVRSSADGGLTWTTADSHTLGATDVTEQLRIMLDLSGNVHVFAVYDVSGTKTIRHFTNRSGAWVDADITADATWAAASKTAGWANMKLNSYSNAAVDSVFMTFYDSATPTFRVASLNLSAAPASVDYDEDALAGGDTGDPNLAPQFAIGSYNYTQRNLPTVFYTLNGSPKYSYRTGVGTYNARTYTLYPLKTRPGLIYTDTHLINGVNNFISFHWDDGTNKKLEVFQVRTIDYFALDSLAEVNFSGTLDSLPTVGVLSSIRGTTSTYGDDDLFYAAIGEVTGDTDLVHLAWETSGTWPTSTTGYDPVGLASDYYGVRPLVCQQEQDTYALSRPGTAPAYIVNVDTGGAADTEYLVGHGDSIVNSIAAVGVDPIADTALAGDTWIVTGGAIVRDTANAGDTYSVTRVISGRTGETGFEACRYTYICSGTDLGSITGVSTGTNAYGLYAITAVGIGATWDSFPSTSAYDPYVCTGTGTAQIGAVHDPYTLQYESYTMAGTGVAGILGVGAATYPSYIASGGFLWATAAVEYPEYTVTATTPGASALEFTGVASSTYPVYTIVVTADLGLSSIPTSPSITYGRYVLNGTGHTAATATASATYSTYQVASQAITGLIATASMEYPSPAYAYSSNDIEIDGSYVIVATGGGDPIYGTASATFPYYRLDAQGQPDSLEVFTGRLVDSEGSAFVDGDGNFIVIQDPTPPQYEVMFTAMNLQKKAVSEYNNFNFNSIGEARDVKYAANYNGIYVIFEDDDDDGDDINASVEKLEVDYDTGMRKRSTDAYVYVKSNGSYEFSSMADQGRSDQTIADSDTVMHTRKIDLAKGLIGRGLGWGFRAEGTDFEIEEVELIIDTGDRRAKRYYVAS